MLRFNQKNFASEPKSESIHSSLSIIVLVYVLFYVHEVKDLAINHNDAIREFTVSEFLFFFSSQYINKRTRSCNLCGKIKVGYHIKLDFRAIESHIHNSGRTEPNNTKIE